MDVQGERMRQGTTPILQITVNNIDLADMEHIYVVFEQNGNLLKKSMTDLKVENNVISVLLTQEETLSFKNGNCNIQLRMVTYDGIAMASPIKTVNVYSVLNKEVIT